MEYRLPSAEDRPALEAYVAEHHQNGETSISASLGLPVMPYDEWLDSILLNASCGNDAWGRSLLYVCLEGSRIIGLLSIRPELSDELAARYGHIGYGVRPSMRRRGYATAMLRYALEVCRQKGMTQVILGCYSDNIASAAVIEKCGGVLTAENDNYKSGRMSRWYSIRL